MHLAKMSVVAVAAIALVMACGSETSGGECDNGAGDLTQAACDKIASDNSCTTHTFSQKTQTCSVPAGKTYTVNCCDYTKCKTSPAFVQYELNLSNCSAQPSDGGAG
jgi:hypothetical protein